MNHARQFKAAMTRKYVLTGFALALAGTLMNATIPAIAQQGPSSAGPADPELIEDLVVANRILADHGVVDGYGHVSVRHNLDPDRFLISRSLAPELVTAGDLLEYDLNGDAVDLQGRGQYSERYIHAAIYKARPDVMAVVHNHSPSVIPFSVSDVKLRPLYHMASFMKDGLPVFDIRVESGITDMLVRSPDRAAPLAETLGDSNAVLMRGHGITVVGPTLRQAVARSIYAEINAARQLDAISLGGEVTYLDPLEAQATLDGGENGGFTRPWDLWKRAALQDMR